MARIVSILWDPEDDEDGNFWHIVVEGHGVAQEEVDEVLFNPNNQTVWSRSDGGWITFGFTAGGSYIGVVWEEAWDDPLTARPITAYPTPPPGERGKKGKKR
jgi:hypothetical protein